jgi:Ni,Fe-hydrogenase III small subunit/ferredoxin
VKKIIPKLFRINTGSCNGCDVEFVASAFVEKFQADKLGIELVEEVENANLLIITGPLTARSLSFFKDAISKLKKPYVVVGIGTCSVSCGIFRDSYAIEGPIDKYIDVDVNIAGCPPRPQSISQGIAKSVKILQLKHANEALPSDMINPIKGFEAPKSFRGKMELDESACTACRTCETVCPSNAIQITKVKDGYMHKIWHNSCCFCGNCAYFCPTNAIFNTNDFDTAKLQSEKYTDVLESFIELKECKECGEKFKIATQSLLDRAYVNSNLAKLDNDICPSCRKINNFKRIYA